MYEDVEIPSNLNRKQKVIFYVVVIIFFSFFFIIEFYSAISSEFPSQLPEPPEYYKKAVADGFHEDGNIIGFGLPAKKAIVNTSETALFKLYAERGNHIVDEFIGTKYIVESQGNNLLLIKMNDRYKWVIFSIDSESNTIHEFNYEGNGSSLVPEPYGDLHKYGGLQWTS